MCFICLFLCDMCIYILSEVGIIVCYKISKLSLFSATKIVANKIKNIAIFQRKNILI